jgi:hypothetical protein
MKRQAWLSRQRTALEQQFGKMTHDEWRYILEEWGESLSDDIAESEADELVVDLKGAAAYLLSFRALQRHDNRSPKRRARAAPRPRSYAKSLRERVVIVEFVERCRSLAKAQNWSGDFWRVTALAYKEMYGKTVRKETLRRRYYRGIECLRRLGPTEILRRMMAALLDAERATARQHYMQGLERYLQICEHYQMRKAVALGKQAASAIEDPAERKHTLAAALRAFRDSRPPLAESKASAPPRPRAQGRKVGSRKGKVTA